MLGDASMFRQKIIIIVVCEGPSERAYIQELNRYFDEEEILLQFVAKPSNGGQFSLVKSKYREVRQNNKKSIIKIWVDKDRYFRNDASDMDHYKAKPLDIPDFLFSYMNYEDFLTMHLSSEKLNNWLFFCNKRNHFTAPSHSSEYLSEFVKFIGNYSKGEIPFEINKQTLENLKKHQEDSSIPFKCDFADELFCLLGNNF